VRSELPADLAGALAAAERGEIPGEHQD